MSTGPALLTLVFLLACQHAASRAPRPAVEAASAAAEEAASPAQPPPTTATRPSAAGRTEVRVRTGDLRPDTLARIVPPIATLRAEPTVLRLAVGDTLWLNDVLRVSAHNAAGRRLGGLPVYDFGLQPGAATLVRDRLRGAGVIGIRAGTGELELRLPQYGWRGAPETRPSIVVPVAVAP